MLVLSAGVVNDPLSALAPDHAPVAMHEVALVLDQLRVVWPPELTVLGLALNVTLGALPGTVTVTVWVALPPIPSQLS